jgi:hypothetical protein
LRQVIAKREAKYLQDIRSESADFVFAKTFRKMFLVFFALDSPGQKQSGKNKTKRKCTVRLIKTGNSHTDRATKSGA